VTAGGPAQKPYIGLRAFEVDEWDRFFGRSTWTRIVVGNLVASRLTLLYGESGVGKTSLLQAGVEHELRQSTANGGGRSRRTRLTPVVFRTWQGDPVAPLIARVWECAATDGEPPKTLAKALRAVAEANSCRVVLILDQFEEYLLYHGNREGPASLPAQLARMLDEPRLPAAALISIREDALSRLDPFKRAIPRLFDNLLHLERVEQASAAEAITGPIDWYNARRSNGEPVEIEEPLVEKILGLTAADGDHAAGEPTVEFAYLQLVLERLWKEARKEKTSRLGPDLLDRIPGGAVEIVRDHVRDAVKNLANEDRDLAAEVFRYLVAPSGGKYAYAVDDLAFQTGAETDRLDRLLDALSSPEVRILRSVGVPNTRGAEARGVEIYHDKFAGPILDWRAEHLELRARERARSEERERARAEAEEAELRRKRRLRRAALIAGGLVATILVALGLLLLLQLKRNNELERATRLASASGLQLGQNPELGLLLAREAVEEDTSEVTVEALRAALVESRLRRVIAPGGGRAGITSMAQTPGGRTLVTGSRDGSVRIWDVASGTVRAGPFPGPKRREVIDIEIGRRRDRFLSAVAGTTEIRSLPDGKLLGSVPPPEVPAVVDDADFARDGASVAVVYRGGDLRVWRSRPGNDAIRLVGSVDPHATSVAFSPDGRLAIVTSDHGATAFRTARRGRGREIVTGPAATATFSRNGERAVIAGRDGRVWLWDKRPGEPARRLGVHPQAVNAAIFNRRGDILATGSMDQTARLWDVERGRLRVALGGHTGGVRGLAFSRDGRRVATSSIDGTVRVWEVESGRSVLVLRGHTAPVQRVFFGKGGLLTSMSKNEGVARVWEVDPGRTPVPDDTLEARNPAPARRSATSPDGDLKAIAPRNRNVVELRATSTDRLLASPAHAGVHDVTFSPDGRTLATSGADSVRVWDARTGRVLAVLGEHSTRVLSAGFSPDDVGRFVLEVSADGCARLWLWGVGGGALAARFPRRPCRVLAEQPDRQIRSARFASNGRELIFTDRAGTVRTYACEVCGPAEELVDLANRRATRQLTPAEKDAFGVED
jgi:WD40 repeat protein